MLWGGSVEYLFGSSPTQIWFDATFLGWLPVKRLRYRLTTERMCSWQLRPKIFIALLASTCAHSCALWFNVLKCAISPLLWKHPLGEHRAEFDRIFWVSSHVCRLLAHELGCDAVFHLFVEILPKATLWLLFPTFQIFTCRCWRSLVSLT